MVSTLAPDVLCSFLIFALDLSLQGMDIILVIKFFKFKKKKNLIRSAHHDTANHAMSAQSPSNSPYDL